MWCTILLFSPWPVPVVCHGRRRGGTSSGNKWLSHSACAVSAALSVPCWYYLLTLWIWGPKHALDAHIVRNKVLRAHSLYLVPEAERLSAFWGILWFRTHFGLSQSMEAYTLYLGCVSTIPFFVHWFCDVYGHSDLHFHCSSIFFTVIRPVHWPGNKEHRDDVR